MNIVRDSARGDRWMDRRKEGGGREDRNEMRSEYHLCQVLMSDMINWKSVSESCCPSDGVLVSLRTGA